MAPARPVAVDGVRPDRPAEGARPERARDDLRPAAHPRRQPCRGDPLRQRDRGDAPAAQRAATRCSPSPGACCGRPRANGAVTDLTGLLESALGAIRRRSLVVLISDFITAPGWERPLLQLTERHEVVAIRLLDPREYELPDAGVIVVEDAETGEQLMVDSSDAEFRRRLREAGEAPRGGAARADAPRRCRHLRGVDRGRPRPGARPDHRVAQAAAPLMSLGSPWMLLCLACVPALVLAYTVGAPAARRARRPARDRRARADGGEPACPLATPHPLRALRGGACARLLRARPPDREPRVAGARGHGDPRLRRLEQHARQGSRADTDRRGEGGGHRVRRAAAEDDPDRRRGVRRRRRHRRCSRAT